MSTRPLPVTDPAPQLGGEPLSYGAFLVESRRLMHEKICQLAEML
jgi:hypothetical protein